MADLVAALISASWRGGEEQRVQWGSESGASRWGGGNLGRQETWAGEGLDEVTTGLAASGASEGTCGGVQQAKAGL